MKWDLRFLQLAETVASWSKDPSTQCGAVIARPDRTVASLGFNGFPRGIEDDPALYEDRDEKLQRVVHAEMNAILHSSERLAGMTLYTWPLATCDRCAVHVIQAGITRVVAKEIGDRTERWRESVDRGIDMYLEAGVAVSSYG